MIFCFQEVSSPFQGELGNLNTIGVEDFLEFRFLKTDGGGQLLDKEGEGLSVIVYELSKLSSAKKRGASVSNSAFFLSMSSPRRAYLTKELRSRRISPGLAQRRFVMTLSASDCVLTVEGGSMSFSMTLETGELPHGVSVDLAFKIFSLLSLCLICLGGLSHSGQICTGHNF